MARTFPLLLMLLAIVVGCLVMIGYSTLYGSEDWTWISQKMIFYGALLAVFLIAMYVLAEYVRR